MTRCPICGVTTPRFVGALCESCARALARSDTYTESTVRSTVPAIEAAGWLLDPCGVPHRLAMRTTIGRRETDTCIVISDASLSREHARIEREADGWTLHDLGSRQGTFVRTAGGGERRHERRGALAHRSGVRFATIGFYAFLESEAPPIVERTEVKTTPARLASYRLGGPDGAEVEIVASKGQPPRKETGYLRFRPRPTAEVATAKLPRLQFQLLRALCEQSLAAKHSGSGVRFCSSAELVAECGFSSDNSLRQAVADLRSKLQTLDIPAARELIGSEQNLGYYLTWPVEAVWA